MTDPGEDPYSWNDEFGDLMGLAAIPTLDALLGGQGVEGARVFGREAAEAQGAGLIEAQEIERAGGNGVSLIHKRLHGSGMRFTGMILVPARDETLVWTIVAGEREGRDDTGVREATVTTQLIEAGEMTLEGYEQDWAQDPYDPEYRGVDRSSLRYRSDDERFDPQFPMHPLSRIRSAQRQILATLSFE